MKILLLTHRVPFPPDRGDRIRSYHILKFLSARADVDLACLADEPVHASSRQEIATHCRRVAIVPLSKTGRWARVLASVARGRSASEGLFESATLSKTLEQWAADTQYDAVFAYCSSMGQYLDIGSLRNTPSVVDFIDVDSEKWFEYASRVSGLKRSLYWLEGCRVQRLEQELLRRANAVTVVSKSEADLVRRVCPNANIYAVPNGVDLPSHVPQVETAPRAVRTSSPNNLDCVFIGALDYFPNVDGVLWFAREVWPELHARYLNSKFTIVGRRPNARIRRLALTPGIDLVGEVLDVRPFLHRARVAIAPLRVARGIQNKVLEALAAGKPVIASPRALDGLDLIPGEHVLEASSSEQWIQCLELLFESESRCDQLANAGREFVCENHRWESCLQPLEALIGLAQQTKPLSLSPVDASY